jgi:hypothetical protein
LVKISKYVLSRYLYKIFYKKTSNLVTYVGVSDGLFNNYIVQDNLYKKL